MKNGVCRHCVRLKCLLVYVVQRITKNGGQTIAMIAFQLVQGACDMIYDVGRADVVEILGSILTGVQECSFIHIMLVAERISLARLFHSSNVQHLISN